MSNRITPRIKSLITSPIKDKETQKLMEQFNSQNKIMDKALSNIRNFKMVSLVSQEAVASILTYVNAGTVPFSCSDFDRDEIQAMVFKATSADVGTSGLTVQLYDKTFSAEIAILTWVDAEDDIEKEIDVKDYLADKCCEIVLEVNVKKTGAGTASTLAFANLTTT